jgi:hypothetical protein
VKVPFRNEGRRGARHAIIGHALGRIPETPHPRGTVRFQRSGRPPRGLRPRAPVG